MVLPDFTKGKKQLSMLEVQTIRNLAILCIHVERARGVACQKYTMLQFEVPISLLQDNGVIGFTTLDKVACVAC